MQESQDDEHGLRERKRRETRTRIADAALDLALAQGVDGATVEAISAAAGVSPRTFFNYFDSKDDALLGVHHTLKPEDVVTAVMAHVDGLTLRQVAARLLVEHIRAGLDPAGRRDERHQLLVRNPQLFATAFRRMNDTQEAFASALRSVAADRGDLADVDPAWADVLLAACVGATKLALKEWSETDPAPTADDIEARVIALLSTTWENVR